jgi:DnaJ-class molecular chaperone
MQPFTPKGLLDAIIAAAAEGEAEAEAVCKSCRGRGTHVEGNDDGSQTCTVPCRPCDGTGKVRYAVHLKGDQDAQR